MLLRNRHILKFTANSRSYGLSENIIVAVIVVPCNSDVRTVIKFIPQGVLKFYTSPQKFYTTPKPKHISGYAPASHVVVIPCSHTWFNVTPVTYFTPAGPT